MFHTRISRLALAVAIVLSTAAHAEDVTLKMKGGAFEVIGALKAYDGQKYVLETKDFGNLTLDAERFECVGTACKTREALPATPQDRLIAGKPDQVLIGAPDHFAQNLLPRLIEGFAQKLGATATPALQASATETRLEVLDASGKDLAYFDTTRETSAAAIAGLIEGRFHIVLADRTFAADEVQKLTAANAKFRARDSEILLGMDVLAMVAHPTLPVDSLPLDAMARVASGAVTDWSELGLPKGRITLHVRAGGAADAFAEQALKPRGNALSSAAEVHRTEQDVAAAVARDPLAIGIVSLSAVKDVKALGIDTACGVVHWPSTFAAKAGEYPFARRLYLLTSGAVTPAAARGFLRFAQSPDVHSIVAMQAFGHRAIEHLSARELVRRQAEIVSAPPKAFDLRLINELQADFKSAQRLSTTLRFMPGGNDLDVRSRTELQRFVEALSDPQWNGKTIIVSGFANAGGPNDQAIAASLKRAAQVRLQILQALGPQRAPQRQVIAKGFGHIAPVACFDGPDGAAMNRRVEIWVRD